VLRLALPIMCEKSYHIGIGALGLALVSYGWRDAVSSLPNVVCEVRPPVALFAALIVAFSLCEAVVGCLLLSGRDQALVIIAAAAFAAWTAFGSLMRLFFGTHATGDTMSLVLGYTHLALNAVFNVALVTVAIVCFLRNQRREMPQLPPVERPNGF